MIEFINELKEILIKNKVDDYEEILQDYQEYFTEELKKKDISEILNQIGNPSEIALEYLEFKSESLFTNINVKNIYLTIIYKNVDQVLFDTNIEDEEIVIKNDVLIVNVKSSFLSNILKRNKYLKLTVPHKINNVDCSNCIVKLKNIDTKTITTEQSVVTFDNITARSIKANQSSIKFSNSCFDNLIINSNESEIKLNKVDIMTLQGEVNTSVIRYNNCKIINKKVYSSNSIV